jgi:hypothetical protein
MIILHGIIDLKIETVFQWAWFNYMSLLKIDYFLQLATVELGREERRR